MIYFNYTGPGGGVWIREDLTDAENVTLTDGGVGPQAQVMMMLSSLPRSASIALFHNSCASSSPLFCPKLDR